jgi:cyclin-dependent kinase 7
MLRISVAIKKIKVGDLAAEGLDMTALREVKFLQELHHPNIIAVNDFADQYGRNLD